MIAPALVTVGAYLLGSVSFAILIARRRGVDVRAVGSGNPGATNVGRALGKRTGRVVLVLDALKGVLPVVALRVAGADPWWVAAAGVAAVVGHCFPIWHGLRGGKGAATGLGATVAASPIAGVAAAITYLALEKITKRASVGSLGGAAMGAGVLVAVEGVGPLAAMGAGVLALVVLRHVENIGRLVRGTEPRS